MQEKSKIHLTEEQKHHLVYQKHLEIKQVPIYSTYIKKKGVDKSIQLEKPKPFFDYSVLYKIKYGHIYMCKKTPQTADF